MDKTYDLGFEVNGKRYSRANQIARCGNSASPPMATAVVRANFPEYCGGRQISIVEELMECVA